MSMKHFLALLLLSSIVLPGASAQIYIIGDLSHDREVRSGEKYEGRITVKNDSEEPQEAKVYQTDYTFSHDGTNSYGDPGTLRRSNARWISFSPSRAVIPPRGTATISYSVNVPLSDSGKALGGSYWSMLMIEGIARGSAESSFGTRDSAKHLGILQTIRYGLQIATHIAGTGTRAIRFIDAKLVSREGGDRALQIDLENSGDLWIRPEVSVEFFDAKGVSRGKVPGTRYRMYPGTSVRQMIDLKTIPPGSYKALVVVDAGGDDVFGAQYTLQL
jgi:hypothetical protein